MHVYVILAEEHKPIFSIFNHHQQVNEALVFQIPVLHKHVQRYLLYLMNFKLLKIFLPTLTSFIGLVGIFNFEDKYHKFFSIAAPNSDPGPQIDIPLLIVLTIPFTLALIFEALAVLPFWTKIKENRRVFGLKLWQIIALISLSLGLLVGVVTLYKEGFKKEVIISCLMITATFAIYWSINFLTLTFIDRS
ncbi:hypothetical protein [Segetibacter koreensis]|uniref:hypothetical protein n=1 Tax=Segetibacter koreensis TaxID=398037 RepID=UPI00037F00E7|nr:hypothetical protein [Segetibacter koreensis]